jgi:hypothetical protein
MIGMFLSKVKFPLIALFVLTVASGCSGSNRSTMDGAVIKGGSTYNIGTEG